MAVQRRKPAKRKRTSARPPKRGPGVPASRDHALSLVREMMLIRRFEEKADELYSLGKIRGFLHLYIGEEAVCVGAMRGLTSDDSVVATYREHGHAISRGISPGTVMAEMYGKVNGCSRGRGGSMHLFDVSRKFYGGHAIVGAGIPFAVGLALADKMESKPHVTACFFGDGAVDEGEFHESMNMASLWKLPVLFICENNLYAMGTALDRHESVRDIAAHARVYGVHAEQVDGMDVLAVEAAVERNAKAIRRDGTPRFLEILTYRFRGHSMADPVLYRSKEEVSEWMTRDPISSFLLLLRNAGLVGDVDVEKLEKSVAAEIDEAVRFAESGEWEAVEDLTRDVYTPAGAWS